MAKLKQENNELLKEKSLLEGQILDFGGELESHKKQTEAAMQEAEQAKIQLSQAKSLRASLDGYRQSLHIITDWVPSQRESIEVLVACSEFNNITLDDLATQTKMAPMILKRNILPN